MNMLTEEEKIKGAQKVAGVIIASNSLERQIHQQLAYNGIDWGIQQLEPIITKLEMENVRLKALLYRWNQLNDPQDFYVCSATLKKETTAILFETNNT